MARYDGNYTGFTRYAEAIEDMDGLGLEQPADGPVGPRRVIAGTLDLIARQMNEADNTVVIEEADEKSAES